MNKSRKRRLRYFLKLSSDVNLEVVDADNSNPSESYDTVQRKPESKPDDFIDVSNKICIGYI